MWFKLFILSTLTITATLAEAALRKSAPYPAAGWRPQKPFNLPGEYTPPQEVEEQQQLQPNRGDIEISKERIDFAGQLQGNSLVVDQTNEPVNAYLPPDQAETDFLSVQRLPNDRVPQFDRRQPQVPQRRKNHQQFFPRPQPQAATQNQPQPQQLGQQPQFHQQQRPQTQPQQFGQQPQQQIGQQPQFNQQQKPQTQPQQFFPEAQPQQFPRPAQQYGAPGSGNINIAYPDPRNLEQDQDLNQANDAAQDAEDNFTAIEALNAAVDAYNRAQTNRNTAALSQEDGATSSAIDAADYDAQSNANGYPGDASPPTRFAQGQYYVLGPDNTLQRVMFTTSQDEQETRTNGFTAQLKYTPVGEVRDPVFKYNNRGQLVRIFKK